MPDKSPNLAMIRARDAAREAAEELSAANVPEPEASAEILLSELLGIRRGELAFHEASEEDLRVYSSYISRRRNREPVQRILGHTYFRNLKLYLRSDAEAAAKFEVRNSPEPGTVSSTATANCPDEAEIPASSAVSRREKTCRDDPTNPSRSEVSVLIPRPDTESVVEAALELIDEHDCPCRVLDIGTGSGAVAISIADERPRSEVHASDVSESALRVAKRNADTAGVAVEFHLADIAGGLENLAGSFDLLVSNPPYIKSGDIPNLAPEVRDYDPHSALDGGPDGLGFYSRIFDEVPPLLKSGADIVLEVGDGQADDVLKIGRSVGFASLDIHDDLAGTARAVSMRWQG